MSTQAWSYDTLRRCPRCGGSIHLEFDEPNDLLSGQCRAPSCGGYEGCSSFEITGLLSSVHGPIFSGMINRTMALAIARARTRRLSFQRNNATWREQWSAPSGRVRIFQVSPSAQPVYFAALIIEEGRQEPITQTYSDFDWAYQATFQVSFAEELRRNSHQ